MADADECQVLTGGIYCIPWHSQGSTAQQSCWFAPAPCRYDNSIALNGTATTTVDGDGEGVLKEVTLQVDRDIDPPVRALCDSWTLTAAAVETSQAADAGDGAVHATCVPHTVGLHVQL